ncbi:hypothetical protein LCGC14_1481880 [marine sediment metagenome]|uniref:Uncharacterized protein n=2 Tax=marine sediment metagenome TaxID=412755 RepID=A0A0F9MB45_9ZZZZ|nr:hypothetical protein [bacterium]
MRTVFMYAKNDLETLIRTYLEKIRLVYCESDISKFLYYVNINNEDFNNLNPQSQTVLDTVNKIGEQEIWNISLMMRIRLKNQIQNITNRS